MSLRYRPSARLITIGVMMVGVLALNYLALKPELAVKQAELTHLQETYANIQQQLKQTMTDADNRLDQQLVWNGADWTQSILDAMNTAQSRVQGIKATYSLGSPATVNLNNEDYWVQQIDLEISAAQDPALFSFIDNLFDTLPGASTIGAMQVNADEKTKNITATLSLSLYRLVQQ